MTDDVLHLTSGPATATIARRGAEPIGWTIAGEPFLWRGAPEDWAYTAPILFPVVGASSGGVVRVDGREHPMPQHGFARTMPFTVLSATADRAALRLADDDATRVHYPFPFALDVDVALAPDRLRLDFTVTNTGAAPLPYGLGVHPAHPWPLGGGGREAHRVVFERDESPRVPGVAAGGLLTRDGRDVALDGRVLALSPALFSEALVFLDARSRRMRFEGPSGAAVTMETEGFPHLAVWSKPTAPFLSLEAWTGHADWAGFAGALVDRDSGLLLAPGATGRHAVTLVGETARA